MEERLQNVTSWQNPLELLGGKHQACPAAEFRVHLEFEEGGVVISEENLGAKN